MAARRSLSFTRSSCAPRTSVSPSRTGGGDEEHGQLVDRERHQTLRHADALQRAAPHLDVRDRLAAPAPPARRARAMSRTHEAQHSSSPVRVGLMPMLRERGAPSLGAEAPGDQEEGRRGEIRPAPRRAVARSHWPPSSATLAAVLLELARRRRAACARCGRARARGSVTLRASARGSPASKQRRLHLRAGHRQRRSRSPCRCGRAVDRDRRSASRPYRCVRPCGAAARPPAPSAGASASHRRSASSRTAAARAAP